MKLITDRNEIGIGDWCYVCGDIQNMKVKSGVFAKRGINFIFIGVIGYISDEFVEMNVYELISRQAMRRMNHVYFMGKKRKLISKSTLKYIYKMDDTESGLYIMGVV